MSSTLAPTITSERNPISEQDVLESLETLHLRAKPKDVPDLTNLLTGIWEIWDKVDQMYDTPACWAPKYSKAGPPTQTPRLPRAFWKPAASSRAKPCARTCRPAPSPAPPRRGPCATPGPTASRPAAPRRGEGTWMPLDGEQGGSIRIPSAAHGLVGLKPTFGLVPYTGVASLEATLHHAGPMTRTVLDNARLLRAVAGAEGASIKKLMENSAGASLNTSAFNIVGFPRDITISSDVCLNG